MTSNDLSRPQMTSDSHHANQNVQDWPSAFQKYITCLGFVILNTNRQNPFYLLHIWKTLSQIKECQRHDKSCPIEGFTKQLCLQKIMFIFCKHNYFYKSLCSTRHIICIHIFKFYKVSVKNSVKKDIAYCSVGKKTTLTH